MRLVTGLARCRRQPERGGWSIGRAWFRGQARELGEAVTAPAQMEEFVLSQSDSLEASGFVQHLKLPHYVDFQSELELLRRLRTAAIEAGGRDERAG